MTRFFGLLLAGMIVVAMAPPASASTYTAWHPNCQDSATDKAECIKVHLYLYNSQGNNIRWDRLYANINADECRITLTNGSTKVISRGSDIYVDSATWYNVGRQWYMPKGCPVKVHARHPIDTWFQKDQIYYFYFDAVTTENNICYRMEWYYENKGTCAEVSGP